MTKSIPPRRQGDAYLNRIAQALRILAVPEGGAIPVAIAPGRLLCGHVIFAAEAEAGLVEKTSGPHDVGADIDTVIATPLARRPNPCSISIQYGSRRYDSYRLCLLPRVSGIAFFASTDPTAPAFHVVRDRLIEHVRPAFASCAERLDAIARGDAALARLVGGR